MLIEIGNVWSISNEKIWSKIVRGKRKVKRMLKKKWVFLLIIDLE